MAAPLTSRKRPGLSPDEKAERNKLIEEFVSMRDTLMGGMGGKSTPPAYLRRTGRHALIAMHPDELRAMLKKLKEAL
jgi:hypothetical protein